MSGIWPGDEKHGGKIFRRYDEGGGKIVPREKKRKSHNKSLMSNFAPSKMGKNLISPPG